MATDKPTISAREYFESLGYIKLNIETTKRRIEAVEDGLSYFGISFDGEYHSEEKVSLSNGVVELISKRDVLECLLVEYSRREDEMHFVIASLSSPIKQQVIGLRYCEQMKLWDIAKKTRYSVPGIKSVIARAIDELDRNGKLANLLGQFEVQATQKDSTGIDDSEISR